MSLADVLSGLLRGAGATLTTYGAVKQAAEEKQHQRLREGIEDDRYREGVNFKYRDETNTQREQDYQHKKDKQGILLSQAKDAGILGITPDSLDASRDGNQVQTGTGAGVGGNQLQAALRSLQIAQQQPGFDPRKQADLGNGASWQGPQFGSEPTPHFSPVQGEDNVGSFDNRTGHVVDTGFRGKKAIAGSGNDSRRYVKITSGDPEHLGQIGILDKIDNTVRWVNTPGEAGQGTAKPFLDTHAIPGQPERDASSAVQELSGAVGDLKGIYSKNGYQSPGLLSQEAMRHGGSIGNAVVGQLDPDYQAVYNKQQFALNNLLYLKSGKVITDNEFKRLRGFLEVGANDTPATVKDKLGRLDTEMQALSVRAGRANGPSGSAAGGNAKADAWDALVAQGVDPDEATQRVNAQFQGR